VADLLDRILEAHGGAQRWQGVHSVLARVSIGGLGFASRLQGNPLKDVEVTVTTAWPSIALAEWPRTGQTGYCQPSRIWIEEAHGALVDERSAPGATFRSVPHWLWWDQLDVLYYCGNVIWQSLCLPFTMNREGCTVRELSPLDIGDEKLQRLAVIYPDDIPSVRSDHVFHADATGLLRRVDFSPLFGGPWVQASQVLSAFETVSGFNCATRHRVYPCMPGGRVLPVGPLGWMDVEDITFAWS